MSKNKITAVLGPTNTGKTHLAIETMLSFDSGMIGFPLRLLAREVYDGFKNNSDLYSNKKLCDVRGCFEKYNLISGLHTVMSEKNQIFEKNNLIPKYLILFYSKNKYN